MFQQLFKSIQEKVILTQEEMELCKTFFIPKRLRKKQILLQEGDICVYNAFIEKGILRSFSIDEKGNEHIVQFAIEGWWIADLSSFLTNSSSIYTIEALEDSELLLLTTSAREALMDKVPMFERYQRLLLQNAYIANQARINSTLTETAEEKYTNLGIAYPGIVQRVPQHMIASYLGLKPETLSRVRKQINNRSSF
ncbi:Crp/Fnr family transcriptional regulator [Flavobacterium sp. GSP27]|uniref:Crp/Fnr family transcriptional regulator n=1 Tax=Flavobacterium bomense TaxID=2497483 RepID=A0A432CP18_9FLAO|nr:MULTISPECIES: Crp/Fnr family transcriptional regulator [Flavobacterium]RTY86102.1 Crp/Fnr family transcriptional regulator [Flavobacterium sp. GSN2]RTY68354.1 Crp/Fnr family transcriptional regulator [Flavobacterium sp. LB2P53]RTY74778.1 Crp/Fnr family transcriptional regulator [Flavobacterium sp. LS1R10]RTY77702.1 Crp/Fnr family transcriptional regulator [Flavobacterium sp. LS1P28]RTY80738.1 Crp/Fnr family transcriptional regulator [Flavobacterium sp. ZB4P23]